MKLARINKKAAAIIAAIVVAGSCTSAAVFQIHRNNSQDNLDSSAVQTEKKQFTPEDMASYIQDSNSLIAEDTQKQIQLYNANWKNAYNQVVAIAITTGRSFGVFGERVTYSNGFSRPRFYHAY